MIVTDILDPEVEDLDPVDQNEDTPMGATEDVVVAEDDPIVPPFNPPGG